MATTIKKGVLTGTKISEELSVDSNYESSKVTIKGLAGNDTISAEEFGGNLYAYAGLGSDELYANNYKNYLYGESGKNTFVLNAMSDETTINAGKGKAIIDFSDFRDEIKTSFFTNQNNFSRNKNDLVFNLSESITGNEESKVIIKDFFKSKGEFIAKYESGEFDLRNLEFTTTLDTKTKSYSGTRLDETITGNTLNNTLKGLDGDDSINGKDGNDKLYGDNGDDTIYGNYGNDTIYGGNGNDLLGIGEYNDPDFGNDVIYGGDGDDTLNGNYGNDKLYGGSGDNTYKVAINNASNPVIYVEKGSNSTVQFVYGSNEITKIYRTKNDLILSDASGNKLTIANYYKYDCPNLEFLDSIGNSKDDTIFNNIRYEGKGTIKGSKNKELISGSASSDKIYSNGGADIINTYAGNDVIYGYMGKSEISNYAGNQVDAYLSGGGKDTLYGKFDLISLGDLYEDAYKDFIVQKVGNDVVIKYTDKDSVTIKDYFINQYVQATSNTNNDENDIKIMYRYDEDEYKCSLKYFIKTEYNSTVTINKGCGTVKFYAFHDETANLIQKGTGVSFSDLKYAKSGNNLIISNFGDKKDKIVIVDYFTGKYDINIDTVGLIHQRLEKVVDIDPNVKNFTAGTFYSEIVTGNDLNNLIKTKDGNDSISGSYGSDTVYAGNGDDTINYIAYSDADKDKLYGEAGNDSITTGGGNDIINGGSGNDTINSYGGNDIIYGENGNDSIDSGAGNDTIYGGAGDDNIIGGTGKDLIKAGAGNDIIYATSNDTIYGEKGNDVVKIQETVSNITIDTGSENDVISTNYSISNATIKMGKGDDLFGFIPSGENKLTNSTIDLGAGNDTVSTYNIENAKIISGSGNDSIGVYGSNYEIDAGAGNDYIAVANAGLNDDVEVEGGAGNDTIRATSGRVSIEDSKGNDTYQMVALADGYQVEIEDSKGNDVLQLTANERNTIDFYMDIKINAKGSIVGLKDTELRIGRTTSGYDNVIIDEYFGSGCIERIETSDGYYFTKAQMQNVAQEVAAWLFENGYDSAQECMLGTNQDDKNALQAIFADINWQK